MNCPVRTALEEIKKGDGPFSRVRDRTLSYGRLYLRAVHVFVNRIEFEYVEAPDAE
jgi:hypothetical protein